MESVVTEVSILVILGINFVVLLIAMLMMTYHYLQLRREVGHSVSLLKKETRHSATQLEEVQAAVTLLGDKLDRMARTLASPDARRPAPPPPREPITVKTREPEVPAPAPLPPPPPPPPPTPAPARTDALFATPPRAQPLPPPPAAGPKDRASILDQIRELTQKEMDKTAIRCPDCGRQMPFEALRMQDVQVCPYCGKEFGSDTYLISLLQNKQQTLT